MGRELQGQVWTRPTHASTVRTGRIDVDQARETTRPWMDADQAIGRRWADLGGAPGQPVGDLVVTADGYWRDHQGGTLYGRPGERPFHVYGAILDRYRQLGGPTSWLGWPTSDEQAFAQGGRATTFEHGTIYWWPDTGPIDLGQVVVRYSGLFCFGETDNDGASAADEPYLIFGVVDPVTASVRPPLQTRIYEEGVGEDDGVDARESVVDDLELFRGLPYGLDVAITLMEHDFGDPDKYRQGVEDGVGQATHAVAAAAATVPGVGPLLSVAVEAVMAAIGDDIVDAINDLFGTDDDFVGVVKLNLTAKQLVTGARAPSQEFYGIPFDVDSPLISGDGASYKAYVVIDAI